MSLSPLLKFALESFEHALEQYMKDTEKSRKFSIMHCDQAIELILKDKLRSLGESIFKANSRTIDYHDALNELTNHKGIHIPEKSDLQLIHDLRNIIQHIGATVSKEQADFYIKIGYDFVKRFLKDELRTELKDHLESRYYKIFEPVLSEQIKLAKSRLEAVAETYLASPQDKESHDLLAMLLFAYRDLEIEALNLAADLGLARAKAINLRDAVNFLLRQENRISKRDYENFEKLRSIRNLVIHTDKVPSIDELKDFLQIANELLEKIKHAR